MKSTKSIGLAVFLSFLLGPIGLFYASITGGIILTFIVPAFLILLFILGFGYENPIFLLVSMGFSYVYYFGYWVIAMIWAYVSVRSYNREVEAYNRLQMDVMYGSQRIYNNPMNTNTHSSFQVEQKNESYHDTTPHLQEWLRNNPDRSINDYYQEFKR